MIRGLLLIPLALAIYAVRTDNLVAKMGVPVCCALLLLGALLRTSNMRRGSLWVVTALVLSAVGDWLLSSKGSSVPMFIAGIAVYFGAHLGYLGYATRHGRVSRLLLASLLLLYLPYYILHLRPAIAQFGLGMAVLFYLLISCVALSAAWGMNLPKSEKWMYVLGMALIVLSDTIISFTEFLSWHRWNWLILPTYYLAHLCVTWSLVAVSGTEQSREMTGVVTE